MADATRSVQVKRQEWGMMEYPVAASTVIYQGTFVVINSSGYAKGGSASAGEIFVGVAAETADNSAGSNGAIRVKVYTSGLFEFKASSITQAMVGQDMYYIDNQTFDETDAGSLGIKVGKLARYISSTKGVLSIGQAVATAYSATNYFPLTFFIHSITSAASDQLMVEDFEMPIPFKIVRAYGKLGTAPGVGKTLTIEAAVGTGSDVQLFTITGSNTKGENESLDIDVPADTDLDIKLTQDTGSAAGLQLMLVCQYTLS